MSRILVALLAVHCAAAPPVPARRGASPFSPEAPWPPAPRVAVPTGDSPSSGPSAAPVVIVAWTDLTCLACSFADSMLREIRGKYGDSVRIVIRFAPDGSSPESRAAAVAALAAGPRFFELAHALFLDPEHRKEPDFVRLAEALHLDLDAWQAARGAKATTLLTADVHAAIRLGLTHTPWIFVNGRSYAWPVSRETLELAIEQELARAGPSPFGYVAPASIPMPEPTLPEAPRVDLSKMPAFTLPDSCPPANDETPLPFGERALVRLCRDLAVDPAMPEAVRAHVRSLFGAARRQVEAAFPSAAEAPLVVVCASEACARAFAGPTLRSASAGVGVKLGDGEADLPRDRRRVLVAATRPEVPAAFVNDLVHEMVHSEFFARIPDAYVPMWFREGVAASIGDAPACLADDPRAIDDLRRLASPKAWGAFTDLPGNGRITYCQARAEVEAWAGSDGRARLGALLEGIRAGRSFDELYGPMRRP